MADTQLFEILLIAAIAAIVLFRLYAVLGRKTGNEPPPQECRIPDRSADGMISPKNVAKPREPVPDGAASDDGVHTADVTRPENEAVSSALFDISLADRNFMQERFLSGARSAYEMVENAFFAGDREALRPLLNDAVYGAFDNAISRRDMMHQSCTFTFVGFKEVKIVAASLRDRTAEITVLFHAQFILATLDANGTVVDGDDKMVQDVRDVWTFARDVKARDPNWLLVATSAEN